VKRLILLYDINFMLLV